MYLLDTNVLSELRGDKLRQSERVRAWAAGVPLPQLFVPAVVLFELERGVLALERRKPPQGAAVRRWLAGVRETFKGRILPFGEDAAVRCALMHVPDPAPLADSMIASTALAHGLTVATRNVADFARLGARVFDPWRD